MSGLRFDFSGKRVLVTGASRGIGYAIARGFAASGARVVLLAEGADVPEAAEALARETGAEVTGVVCDIADRAAVAAVVGDLGPLDVLVNNAGLERLTPIAEPGPEVEADFRRITDINVVGSFYVTREALPLLGAGGRILFTASIWGKSVEAEFAAYCSSKHAVIGLTRTLAKELGPRGITVNAVCPGWVRTEASLRSLHRMAERAGRDPEAVLADIVAGQALPGLMVPEDVVSAYLFLASDLAANITGQALNVDRGEVMQ